MSSDDMAFPDYREAAIAELTAKRQADLALARKLDAEALHFEGLARVSALEAEEKEVDRRKTRASFEEGHICRIGDTIGSSSVAITMQRLRQIDREAPGCDIEINITSPGGQALYGVGLFDYIRDISNKGHRITTVVNGVAASMGAILIQAGDWRVMGRESWMLVHEVALSAEGKVGDLEDLTKWAEKACERVANIFVDHSGGKITLAKFKTMWRRTDWWLDSEEALKWGFVDEVR